MSEPVIKGVPFRMCPRCFNTGDHVPECLLDEVDPPPRETVYTRDDLLRAVEAACKRWNPSTQDDIDKWNAEMLVDRLTKGET